MAEKISHIVRIANTDILGKKPLVVSLTKIKGVGMMYSNMICKLANLDRNMVAGTLTKEESERLTDILMNPNKYDIPSWMKNRQADHETGEDEHIITGKLQFIRDQDIRKMKKIRSYRGVRHMSGLPTKGQRTKSNFRRNKGKAVGVKRKSGSKSGRV